MTKTTIEWTEHTWNPVVGCYRVSPGCDNCYAMHQAHRFRDGQSPLRGLTKVRPIHADRPGVDWNGTVRLVHERLAEPLRRRKPTTWFVNSMSDLFHRDVPDEYIAAVFGVMAACPQHTFQVLTKRAERLPRWYGRMVYERCPWTTCHFAALQHDTTGIIHQRGGEAPGRPWPLPNVWIGVSAENQETFDERVPHLASVPAAVRFLSLEPLLGPIDFRQAIYRHPETERVGEHRADWLEILGYGGAWVIVGGESGPKARPMDVAWVRSILEQCREAGVPAFVKQLGAWPRDTVNCVGFDFRSRKGGDPSEWPADLRVRQMPEVRR